MVYDYFNRHTMWWKLLIVLIDSNLISTTFFGFIQLSQPGCINFQQKINLVITVLYLFMNFIFPFIMYFFVFKNIKRENGEIFLSCSKYTLKGFILELILHCISNFCRGVIHALFLRYL